MKYILFIMVCIQCYIINKLNFPIYDNLFINCIYFMGLFLFTVGIIYISKNFVSYLKKEEISLNKCFYIIFIIFFITLTYNFFNNWAYYFFDIITKLAPVIAAFGAYYMWSKNREKEIKELEYKQDYYKKIIDKRMQAYQELNDLLCLVNQRMDIILDDKKGKEIFSWCLRNKESFSDVIEKVEIVHTYIIWFSNDMRKILLDYMAFLCIIYNYVVDEKAGEKYFKKLLENYGLNIDMVKKQKEYFCSKNNFNGEFDEDLLAIGLVISDTLLKETNDLMCKLNNDMETLHDIDKFFKEKAPK